MAASELGKKGCGKHAFKLCGIEGAGVFAGFFEGVELGVQVAGLDYGGSTKGIVGLGGAGEGFNFLGVLLGQCAKSWGRGHTMAASFLPLSPSLLLGIYSWSNYELDSLMSCVPAWARGRACFVVAGGCCLIVRE